MSAVAIRSTLDVYSENKRVVVTFDTAQFGRLHMICVGAMLVSSINFTIKVGDIVKKGQDLGYYAFGGSTVSICAFWWESQAHKSLRTLSSGLRRTTESRLSGLTRISWATRRPVSRLSSGSVCRSARRLREPIRFFEHYGRSSRALSPLLSSEVAVHIGEDGGNDPLPYHNILEQFMYHRVPCKCC